MSTLMNIHHLELFFYVAKFEGITAAVRKMPYGIQQPAVSGQLLQLEEKLGVKLFNRRPFALTPAGEELYDYCYPFFSRLRDVEERLRGEESQHLRLAASASTLRNHLPDVLEDLKKEEPNLRLSLKEVDPSDVHHLLTSQQVDIAVSVLAGKLAEGLRSLPLVEIPVALLVPWLMRILTTPSDQSAGNPWWDCRPMKCFSNCFRTSLNSERSPGPPVSRSTRWR